MNNVSPFLPKLALNRQFVYDLMDADVPCCALGMIEVRKQKLGLLAIRPSVPIPAGASSDGFELGHSLLGGTDYEVIHFAFEFPGVATYNVLINPGSPLVKTVIGSLIEHGDYFILVIQPDDGVTVFRAGGNQNDLSGLRDNLSRTLASSTTPAQYDRTLQFFKKKPYPPGQLLNWACRDDVSYLDLAKDRLELNPSAT